MSLHLTRDMLTDMSSTAPAWTTLTASDKDAWKEEAICAQTDPDLFFPEKGGSTREAKRICMTCPVRMECLQDALDREDRFGIWGGLSERERRKLIIARKGTPRRSGRGWTYDREDQLA